MFNWCVKIDLYSQAFVKNVRKPQTQVGDFFDSHCKVSGCMT